MHIRKKSEMKRINSERAVFFKLQELCHIYFKELKLAVDDYGNINYLNRDFQIMPYKEKVIEKKYFSIGEVAEMLDVATSLIRFWESEFDIIKPKKNRKGNRQFTREDIDNVKLIYHLVKEKGYTLQGAKDLLKNGNDSLKENIEIIDSLKKVKKFLLEIRSKFA